MNWPPLKAWTSIVDIDEQVHFVAINYGGKQLDRWVVLMSVIDSSVVVKVPWSKLTDKSIWQCGWHENNVAKSSELSDTEYEMKSNNLTEPSLDSGLTIPITKNIIRPWFSNV